MVGGGGAGGRWGWWQEAGVRVKHLLTAHGKHGEQTAVKREAHSSLHQCADPSHVHGLLCAASGEGLRGGVCEGVGGEGERGKRVKWRG